MRHIISDQISVVTFETGVPTEPAERFSYYVVYADRAGQLRESETLSGFVSADHCISDAKQNLDTLDLTPEVEATQAPRITVPYHNHLCKQSCGIHRCVNPACEVQGEFTAKRIAEVLCPVCGEQTGSRDFFELQPLTVATFMPLEATAKAA